MVEFAGYEMPVQYPKGIIAEHKAVREGAGGVFDVSHMGEFDVRGSDALRFLQTANAVRPDNPVGKLITLRGNPFPEKDRSLYFKMVVMFGMTLEGHLH